MKSIYQNLGGVINMPNFQERKLYMHKTAMNDVKLPSHFADYTQTVNNVLNKIKNRDHVCYITIDEKKLSGTTHRRAGAHVDFNWYENLNGQCQGGHGGQGSHGGGHKRILASGEWGGNNPYWGNENPNLGGMLLVSNHEGCQVWKGDYEGEIGEGGCCKNINLNQLDTEIMPAGHVYYLNSLGIHESIIVPETVNRSLIRINFHPEYNFIN